MYISIWLHDMQTTNNGILTLKHREMQGCVVSTVATNALVLKHLDISIHNCWLNIHCIGPVSYKKYCT